MYVTVVSIISFKIPDSECILEVPYNFEFQLWRDPIFVSTFACDVSTLFKRKEVIFMTRDVQTVIHDFAAF